MVIRRQQTQHFSDSALTSFEDRVSAHLHRCFADWCRKAGEGEARNTIRHGISQAAAYGITAERDVCKYIDLMVVFGPGFDCDPALPWAGSILKDATLKDPSIKMESLFERAKEESHGQPW